MSDCPECGGTYDGYELCVNCDDSLSKSIVDELEAACRLALECCGASGNWNGETRKFLVAIECALERADEQRRPMVVRDGKWVRQEAEGDE